MLKTMCFKIKFAKFFVGLAKIFQFEMTGCGMWKHCSVLVQTLISYIVIRGSQIRITFSAFAPRQGILSTIASLDPGIANGTVRNLFLVGRLQCAPLTVAGCSRCNNT